MATLLRTLLGRSRSDEISRYSLQQYIRELQNAQLGFGGLGAATTQNNGRPAEDIENSFTGYINGAYKRNGVIFAIILSRLLLFTEARFCFRDSSGKLTANAAALALLRRPWPNGTTGELLARMEQDVSLAGNFYAVNEGDRLRRLRPDWVSIILSAPPEQALASDVIGYQYSPGGHGGGEAEYFLPDEVCHWSPIPDPDAMYRGMSWLTPVIEEITADGSATTHKRKFFDNAATPQVIVKVPAELTITQFKEFVAASRNATEGVQNSGKTWYVGGGADPTVVGANLQQMDFKATQGAGETRICAAGGVPPIIVGLSEGLSSATYSNYGMARRKFGDHWARPTWRSACAALSVLVDVPADAELWYDDRDIAFLREDQKDAAEIQQILAHTINNYVINGFTPKSAVAAVDANDRSLLEHTGLVSVQLLPPGQEQGAAPALPAAPAAVARRYNPRQARGPHTGKWIGAALGSPAADRLKLADRIKLGEGERLLSSDRIRADQTVLTALTDGPHGRVLRLGVVDGTDSRRWTGANKGGTARLDEGSITALSDALTHGRDRATTAMAAGGASDTEALAEGVVKGDWADIRWRFDDAGIDGARWTADLAVVPHGTSVDDPMVQSTQLNMAELKKVLAMLTEASDRPLERANTAPAVGPSAGDADAGQDPGVDVGATDADGDIELTAQEWAALATFIAAVEADESPDVARAKRGDRFALKRWWTHGAGRALWVAHPHPWTALRDALIQHAHFMPGRAARVASQWFKDVFGIWPGERKGANPVGPG